MSNPDTQLPSEERCTDCGRAKHEHTPVEDFPCGHRSKEEKTTINWPTSKGDPIKPVWSYGGKKGMSQAEALRAFAHDLVEIIKEHELPLREAIKQAGGDGLTTYPYIKMLTKRINNLESENHRLREQVKALVDIQKVSQ